MLTGRSDDSRLPDSPGEKPTLSIESFLIALDLEIANADKA